MWGPQATPPEGAAAVDVPADATPEMPLRLVRRWRGWKRVRRTCYLLVALLVGYYLVSLWQVWRAGESDQARPVDAIVVMGAAQYDGRPAAVLTARLDHVLKLYEQGFAPLVVTTGANQPGDRFTEAQASAAYLVERGVPESAIIQVGGSTSYAELELAADALRAQGLTRVLLVSDPYHSLRIRLVAEELGLTAYVSPTRTSPIGGWAAFRQHMKEAAGVSLGRLIGFDRLLSLTG